MSDDLERLRKALAQVEVASRRLPWAKQSPWKLTTHVWNENDVPTIDLHDLSVRLGRQVIESLDTIELDAGALRLITVRG